MWINIAQRLYFEVLITYWGTSIVFMLIDYLAHINGIDHKIKIKDTNDATPLWNPEQYKQIIWNAIFHFVTIVPISTIAYSYMAFATLTDAHEHIGVTILRFIVPFILTDFTFYAMHRLMHTRQLYQYHKQHHLMKNCVAVGAIYASTMENIFVNFGAVLINPLLCGLQPPYLDAWIILAIFFVTTSHSGYNFGYNKPHDDHHKVFNCCYGPLGIADWVFKTRLCDGSTTEKQN